MNKFVSPRDLAIDLLPRSTCKVRVAAVITDLYGRIISWGWNHPGPQGMGVHAEIHAISRANKVRLGGGIIFVAGVRKNGALVPARPCSACQKVIAKYRMIYNYRAKDGGWDVV